MCVSLYTLSTQADVVRPNGVIYSLALIHRVQESLRHADPIWVHDAGHIVGYVQSGTATVCAAGKLHVVVGDVGHDRSVETLATVRRGERPMGVQVWLRKGFDVPKNTSIDNPYLLRPDDVNDVAALSVGPVLHAELYSPPVAPEPTEEMIQRMEESRVWADYRDHEKRALAYRHGFMAAASMRRPK